MENTISTDYLFTSLKRNTGNSLFSYLFGNSDYKYLSLQLYNSLTDRDYRDSDMIEIDTIYNSFFIHYRNDVSLMIENEINPWTKQSGCDPNAPLRGLFFFMEFLNSEFRQAMMDIQYTIRPIPLEISKLFSFYYVNDKCFNDKVLALSDSFRLSGNGSDQADAAINVRVKRINIAYQENDPFLNSCKPLREYAYLIDQIKQCMEHDDVEKAVSNSLNNLPDDFEIKMAIDENRYKLKERILAEIYEQQYFEMIKEDAKAEGLVEGKERRLNEILQYMTDSGFSKEAIEKIRKRFSAGI